MTDPLRELALEANESFVAAKEPAQFLEQLEALWEKGLPPGSRTGWFAMDKHYTVAPGQFTVITGWPGSGKSEWLDALLMNLARQGWRFSLFSPENYPSEIHVSKMLEKFVGKPFGTGPTERLSRDELTEAVTEINDWFSFIVAPKNSDRTNFSIVEILAAAELKFKRAGLWHKREHPLGIVIDPWNELEHLRPSHQSETEYVSETLSYVRSWARQNNVHIWMVAHPQKLRRDDSGKLPIPRPDAISGSIHWWNKADNAITVWRDMGDTPTQEVSVFVWKVRFKHIGRPGEVKLSYDRVTGRYHEPVRDFRAVA